MIQVVGVAGKCCAGKDLVTDWLVDQGWREINVDRIGHEALVSEHTRIVATFGRGIVGESGTIDRRRLGAMVFSDPGQLARLEAIVHPVMRERIRIEIEVWRSRQVGAGAVADPARGLVINAALLFHMRLDRLCDAVLLVRAPLITRVRRARQRDDIGWRQIVRRLRSQRHLDTQARHSPADTITVENGRSVDALHRQLAELPQFR